MRREVAGHSRRRRDLSELEKVQKDLLWGEYTELRTHVRHSETVRTNAISFVLLLTSALVTVIVLDKYIRSSDVAPSLIITGVGIFSTAFSILYLERYDKNKARAACVRRELDRLYFDGRTRGESLSALRRAGDERFAQRTRTRGERIKLRTFEWITKVVRGTHLFWVLVPMLVTATGITLTLIALSA